MTISRTSSITTKLPYGKIAIPLGGQLTLDADGKVVLQEIDKVEGTWDKF